MALEETWEEPARRLPVVARPDVLVVGAGAAGIAAATAAARAGASTWLVDAAGGIGGLATDGLIALLLTLDDGAGSQVVAGLCQELVDRLGDDAVAPARGEWNAEAADAVDRWRRWGLVWGAPESVRYSVAFDPDRFVDAGHDLLDEAGVHLRLKTWFAGLGATADHPTGAVVVESKAGRQAIVPGAIVDATGDADVMVAAGATTESVTIPPHLWFRVGGVAEPGASGGPLWFRTPGAPGRVLVPWGPDAERVDPCDPDDMTATLVRCRRAARAAFDAMRAGVPGFADAWLDDLARIVGITESRRLVGDRVLAKEDGDAAFPDAVACTGPWTRRDVTFDIPFGCLTAPGVTNVVAAGRCISTTRYVHQATKEIPAAMATGEAAGRAAAAAAAAGVDVHDVDVARLRAELEAAGAIVTKPARSP